MSRGRLPVLLALAGMVVAVLAVSSVAWAAPGRPTVVSTVPADEATEVSVTANVKAKFSEKMRAASINENTFVLYEGRFSRAVLNDGCQFSCDEGPPVAATVSYNPDNRTATLNPDEPLQGDTTYTVVVEGVDDSDDKTVRDRDGKPMARDYIWHFTTGSGGCGACE